MFTKKAERRMKPEDKLKVILNELAFLIENPEYLPDVAEWIAKLTPEMIERQMRFLNED
jgi:hypothetical protein